MPDLTNAHKDFFEQLNVDHDTGKVSGPYLKFASYPHVGSCYGKMRKVLIVGMDIGYDHTEGESRIYSYEERRRQIEDECPRKLNPHMSGTYITAMHFLKNECREWEDWLNRANNSLMPQRLLSDTENLPDRNPLRYIAFTNDFKFLLIPNGEKVRIDNEKEERFLVEEAKTLEPEVIVFQSAGFRHRSRKKMLQQMAEIAQVFVGDHPSVRGKRRELGNFLNSIQCWRPPPDSTSKF